MPSQVPSTHCGFVPVSSTTIPVFAQIEASALPLLMEVSTTLRSTGLKLTGPSVMTGVGAENAITNGAPIIAFGPTDLKLIDTTINSGTGLASICATTGTVVDDTSAAPQCVENSCDGTP